MAPILRKATLAAALILATTDAQADDHENHFEWSGMFKTSDAIDSIWVSQKVDGVYADATMNMALVPSETGSLSSLRSAQETAEALFESGACAATVVGSSLAPSATACFQLMLNENDYESKWPLSLVNVATEYVAVVLNHDPSEFEAGSHYLRTSGDGDDVEPLLTDAADHDDHDDHDDEGAHVGEVFLACLLLNLITLSGVAVLGLGFTAREEQRETLRRCLNGFSSGALLACAMFLMLLESSHLVEAEWGGGEDGENQVTWRWGVAVLAGFAAPLLAHGLADANGCDALACVGGRGPAVLTREGPGRLQELAVRVAPGARPLSVPDALGTSLDGDVNAIPSGSVGPKKDMEAGPSPDQLLRRNASEAASVFSSDDGGSAASTLFAVCLGDAFHNFTDGVLVGTAFKLCGRHMAWGVVAASAGHEVAQEVRGAHDRAARCCCLRDAFMRKHDSCPGSLAFMLPRVLSLRLSPQVADFVMLTSPPLGLATPRALCLNFGVGLSVIAGGLLVLAVDVSDGVLGLLLACGAGTYLYLGAVVSLPVALTTGSRVGIGADGVSQAKPASEDHGRKAMALCSFALGCIVIGLILLDHKHCEAGHESHGDQEAEEDHGAH